MRRTLVIASLVLAWGVVAIRSWPLPARPTPPNRLAVMPMTTQPDGTCSTQFFREIRNHPHWTIRIDELARRWCGNDPDRRLASIVLTADSATWNRDGRERDDDKPFEGVPIPQGLELTATERAAVLAALDLPCGLSPYALDGDVIVVGSGGDAVTRFEPSPASERLQWLFIELEARYIAARAPLTRGLAVQASYRVRDWDDRLVRRTLQHGGELDAEQRVGVADCILSLPHDRHPAVTGAMTLDGVRVPIMISRTTAERYVCLRYFLFTDGMLPSS